MLFKSLYTLFLHLASDVAAVCGGEIRHLCGVFNKLESNYLAVISIFETRIIEMVGFG
jgi:hypothetical protein